MIFDGLINFATGLGVPGTDKAKDSRYENEIVDPSQWMALYRHSWAGRRVVDIPVGDMLREWRTWNDESPDVVDRIVQVEKDLGVRARVKEALTLARASGASAIYLGQAVGSDEPGLLAEPLDINSLRPGDVQYLTVFNRTELSVSTYDEDFRSPRYRRGITYTITRGGAAQQPIHWTRFIWFDGVGIDTETRALQDGWADSVFVGLEPLIQGVDTAIQESLSLLPEAKVDVLGVENLDSRLETDDSTSQFLKWAQLQQYMKSTRQMVLLDKEDNYSSKTVNLTGLSDMARTMIEILAGAADIPITRFMGQSPGGLNSTGDSDIRNYYDGIASKQENELRPALEKLDTVLLRIAGAPGTASYTWNNLWQLTQQEQVSVGKDIASTIVQLSGASVFDPLVLSDIAKNMVIDSDAFPNSRATFEEAEAYAYVPTEQDITGQ